MLKEAHDATQIAGRIFKSAYTYKFERSQGLANRYLCAAFFAVGCYLLVISLSNMNGYRFSHCMFISFIYVQLIASILLNRWSPHFSNFLLGVSVNSSQLNMFVPTR